MKRWKQHRHETGYGHLYQGRYKCFPVQTEDYFYHVVRYVVRNALRANLVEKAELWRWSSLGRERSKIEEAAFPIHSDWPLPRPVGWLDIVNQLQSEAELAAVRRCVNRGCPYGDANWVAQTARGTWAWNRPFAPEGDRERANNHPECPSLPRFGGCHLFSVYQGRFKSFPVESDEHFYAVVRYVERVERNALRAGLVERAEDWPWGSLHQRARKAGGPLLGDWPLPEPSDWTEHVNAPQTEAELQAIRRSVRRGSPYGSAFWIEQTAKQLGLESTLRVRGRLRGDSS